MPIVRMRLEDAPKELPEHVAKRLDAMTPEQREQNALDDPDNPPWTDEELERGRMGCFVRQTREATGLSQEKFAQKFGVNVARLRDWEQGRHLPDSFSLSFLRVIRVNPKAVEDALERAPPSAA